MSSTSSVVRCRRCGSKMSSTRVDEYRVKFSCTCGFSEYENSPRPSNAINPNLIMKDLSTLHPMRFDNKGRFVLEAERADREEKELISIEEISMLASSDYDLDEVLKGVAEKTAKRLGVDICSIYLFDGEKLVLRGTYGLAQDAVGVATLALGEGVTGAAAKSREAIFVSDIQEDERYHYFPETSYEQHKIRTMYSSPIFSGGELLGALNAQTVVVREISEDERTFVSVVANMILVAVKMRKGE